MARVIPEFEINPISTTGLLEQVTFGFMRQTVHFEILFYANTDWYVYRFHSRSRTLGDKWKKRKINEHLAANVNRTDSCYLWLTARRLSEKETKDSGSRSRPRRPTIRRGRWLDKTGKEKTQRFEFKFCNWSVVVYH